ncbi:phospholipase D-like domain-containing protein [Elongatibacter sediminis]|uniref:Phospholipase D family protein n=1 Tax=Elongatibacter sediminis TaxID=3119006 RepID=A0AAW9RGR2_9GAMM
MLLLCALLSGCQLSPARVERVDQAVEQAREQALSCPATERDRCSANSPVMEMAARAAGDGRNRVLLLETGGEALELRVHLIRAARDTIDLQNFILRADQTGTLVLNELLDAARRGVRVRLLLDQMFTVADLDYLVKLTMAHVNFEIRFYNPSFHKARTEKHDWISGVACCFRRFNQRMHNKLMVVDELAGIVGGRNIADRYFDFDTNYNFKDRDAAVYGPAARDMRVSFDRFWKSPDTVPVQYLRDVAEELLNGADPSLETYHPPLRLLPLLERVANTSHVRARFVDPVYRVERVEFFSDWPRKQAAPENAPEKDITRELHDVLAAAHESIVIQSPYLVLSPQARDVFRELRERNPEIELVFSTNSLASTDADTVYGNTHRHKKRYIDSLGFQMYEFKPFPADAPEFFPRLPALMEEKRAGLKSDSVVSGDGSTIDMPAPRAGLHSKSFVVDGKVAMIGSHNFDPRSEDFNTENGLIVWDEAFAGRLEAVIRRDIEPGNSWVVAMKPDDGDPVADDLPFIDEDTAADYWSRGPTSAYELIPGHEPLPPNHPDFYLHYYPVGSFPDVVRTRRQYLVLLLGSIFFFLEPIL